MSADSPQRWSPYLVGALAVAVAALLVVAGEGEDRLAGSSAVRARVNPLDVYDPYRAGEPLPGGYRQVVSRDQIAPVYNPVFTTADSADWPDDALVIGVVGAREAKAYPVTHLNSREMVLDEIEGTPILVSW